METASKKNRKLFDEHYEIVSLIGRGSRSVVYFARLASNPSTQLALKVLLPQKIKGKVISNTDRLRKEALAMVSARHRFVIRLDDFHTVNDISYLVMEYAHERDLIRYVSKQGGRLDPEQGELFFTQAATALDFVHRTGIIHRDIKPSNILVINHHESRLADFGVATLPGEKSNLTELAAGVGTMDYMAPEVLEGTSYDTSSDLYSLCLSFYELLSGKHPFQDVSMAKQLEARRDPNISNIRKVAPGISHGLATAIMQGLQYQASDRPASAGELLQIVSGKKRQTPPSTSSNESEKQKRGKAGDTDAANKSNVTQQPQDKSAKKQTKEAQPASSSRKTSISQKTPDKAALDSGQQEKSTTETPSTTSTSSKKKSRSAQRRARKKAAQKRKLAEETTATQPKKTSRSPDEQSKESNIDQEQKVAVKSSQEHEADSTKSDVTQSNRDYSHNEKVDDTKVQTKPERDADYQRPYPPQREQEDLIKKNSYFQDYLDEPTQSSEQDSITQDFDNTAPGESGFEVISSMLKKHKKQLTIIVGLLLVLYLFFPNIWKDLGTLIGSSSVYDHPAESPLPRFSADQLVFPSLPAGVYHGSINNLFPNSTLPLAIISWPEQNSLAVVVGMEGWTPTIINFDSEDLSESQKLRITANGFVIDMIGQPKEDKFAGEWKNVISQEQGTWEVRPVK